MIKICDLKNSGISWLSSTRAIRGHHFVRIKYLYDQIIRPQCVFCGNFIGNEEVLRGRHFE